VFPKETGERNKKKRERNEKVQQPGKTEKGEKRKEFFLWGVEAFSQS